MAVVEVKHAGNSPRITVLSRYFRRNWRSICSASGALVWVYYWRRNGDAWLIATGGVHAVVRYVQAWGNGYEDASEEPDETDETDPDRWFTDLCQRARLDPPMVLKDWPTKDGHAFYVLVTHAHYDWEPIHTVESFIDRASLLRDVAGLGCESVQIGRDAKHGGRATVYVNGIRLAPAPKAAATCHATGCTGPQAIHVIADDLRNHYLCETHADIAAANGYPHQHDLTNECGEGETLDLDDDEHDDDGSGKECIQLEDPLLPQHLPQIDPGEGSGVWSPPAPGCRRPDGAEPGTQGGDLFDLLAATWHPLGRASLAQRSGLSAPHVSRLLADWLRTGAVQRIGQTWRASQTYRTSGTITNDGREEAAGE